MYGVLWSQLINFYCSFSIPSLLPKEYLQMTGAVIAGTEGARNDEGTRKEGKRDGTHGALWLGKETATKKSLPFSLPFQNMLVKSATTKHSQT